MPALPILLAAADDPWLTGLALGVVIGVLGGIIVWQWRWVVGRRARGKPARGGDPHYDPYADSPVPFEPDPVPCVRCRTPLPRGARFCPECGV